MCLSDLGNNSRLAVAVSREHAHSVPSPEFYCFKDSQSIYSYSLKFLTRKNFPHLKKLNEFIEMASATGHIKKWSSFQSISKSTNKETKRGSGQLGLHQYYGALIVYGVLFLIVITSFFVEKLIYKRARMSNSSRIWLHAEMIIDPKKYF